jgi:hypothetical protein
MHFQVLKAFSKVKPCIFRSWRHFRRSNHAFSGPKGIFEGEIMHFQVLKAFSKVFMHFQVLKAFSKVKS